MVQCGESNKFYYVYIIRLPIVFLLFLGGITNSYLQKNNVLTEGSTNHIIEKEWVNLHTFYNNLILRKSSVITILPSLNAGVSIG